MAINTCPSRSLHVSCIAARCFRCAPGGDPWFCLCVVCSAYRTYQRRRNSAASETGYCVFLRPRAPLRIHTQTVFSTLRSTEANYSGGKWLRMDRHRQRAMLRDTDARIGDSGVFIMGSMPAAWHCAAERGASVALRRCGGSPSPHRVMIAFIRDSPHGGGAVAWW